MKPQELEFLPNAIQKLGTPVTYREETMEYGHKSGFLYSGVLYTSMGFRVEGRCCVLMVAT